MQRGSALVEADSYHLLSSARSARFCTVAVMTKIIEVDLVAPAVISINLLEPTLGNRVVANDRALPKVYLLTKRYAYR
jgi:hypothetical protein